MLFVLILQASVYIERFSLIYNLNTLNYWCFITVAFWRGSYVFIFESFPRCGSRILLGAQIWRPSCQHSQVEYSEGSQPLMTSVQCLKSLIAH